ncbi:STM4011 family radical SAM protein [Deinococcus marmoris]|uniref:STM4011 family radical SAM protein n=1 Tax=Deinococcus marmoris TaxID=249408 RepID=UPI000ABD99C7|nr:STM4011 family radical SAM protein [Deinococcus marmoris]
MELDHLSVIYRGPLSSCNYACPYCPFAKHTETAAEHAADARALARFVAWAEAQPFDLSVFFTPWGEALVRPRYQQALARLSRLPHVRQLAIQTNLSGSLKWLEDADKSRIGLWATYHPGEVGQDRFLARCTELDARGVRYSVGVVGKKGHFEDIEAMRAALPTHVYLWINAFKVGAGYYSAHDLARLGAVDPLFEVNTRRYRTRGLPCGAGETVISVEGDGTARRCHFIERPIGNIYTQDVRELLRPRPCSRASCECHIGYVHLSELDAAQVYGDGLLARIPDPAVWADRERLEAYLARARGVGKTPLVPSCTSHPPLRGTLSPAERVRN